MASVALRPKGRKMLPTEIIERFRIDKGSEFKLADFDPDDTCGLDIDKKDAKELLESGREAARHVAGAALCRRPLGRSRDPARHRHVGQGRRHQARDVGRQSAGLRGPFLQGAERARDRSRLPMADCDRAADARPHRHLQPLLLRGDDGRARPSRAACKSSDLPQKLITDDIWQQRFEDINNFELLPRA